LIATLEKRWPSLPYVLPFASFMVFLAIGNYFSIAPSIDYPVRIVVLSAILYVFSRRVIDLRSRQRLESVILGVAVFVIWVGPDILFPGYRQHWLFQNAIIGRIGAPVPEQTLMAPVVLWPRIIRAVVLVPIIEELFWRAWLMRWLISPKFEQIKLGAYAPMAFWITAILFASEHGPYWDVGLITGVLYNWWMMRTKSLADCILAHAVTNACLAAYVLTRGQWQYWL